jgi:hypothetical protein
MGIRDTVRTRLLGRSRAPGPTDATSLAPKSNWSLTPSTPSAEVRTGGGLNEGVDALLAAVPVPPPPPRGESVGPLKKLAGVLDASRQRRGRGDVRKLMNAIGMLAIGFGIAAIVLGWYGASHSPYLFQEVPYVISGGILGLGLIVTGAVLVVCSWSLRQIQEERRNAQAMVRSVERLERLLSATLAAPMNGSPNPTAEAAASRATSSGSNQ